MADNYEAIVDAVFDDLLDQDLLINPAQNSIKITDKGIVYWKVLNEIIIKDKVDVR